jgi:putative mRNA 3-end processing factor
LQSENKVSIFGKETDIELNWEKFSFSTHAGHNEIVNFVKECEAKEVVVYHTDPNEARPHLEEELTSLGIKVYSPENGISYNLND